MTPKEKAKELYRKYNDASIAYDSGDHTAKGINESIMAMVQQDKRCAMICVDELIESYSAYTGMHDQEFFTSEKEYWLKVKAEITNL